MRDNYKDNRAVKAGRTAVNRISIPENLAGMILSVIVMLAAFGNIPVRAADYKITINGVELHTDETLEVRDLALFMPLDDSVLTALGAELTPVPCDGECFDISAYSRTVMLTSGSGEILTDDGRKVAAPAVYAERDVFYVPAEAFFQGLGLETSWDDREGILSVIVISDAAGADERASRILGVKLIEKEQKGKEIKEEIKKTADETAGSEEGKPFLDYTYENTLRFASVRIAGDKTKSNTEEKGDAYNQFNIRFMGLTKSGYDFNGVIRTRETTDTQLNRGQLNRMELGWTKDQTSLTLFDAQPDFGLKYAMRNYDLRGVAYERTIEKNTWQFAAGEKPKKHKQSQYNRYVAAARLRRNISRRKKADMGFAFTRIEDNGPAVDSKKQDNNVASFNISSRLSPAWDFSGEAAGSFSRMFPNSADRGIAAFYKLNYSGKTTVFKATYERTGSGFYSETSSFTRGKTETILTYSRKLNTNTSFSLGAKDKKLKDKTTKSFPMSLNLKPVKSRENFKTVIKRNFDKTSGVRGLIVDKRELQIKDKLGSNNVDLGVSRQKKKTPGRQLAYQDQKHLVVNSALSEKLSSMTKIRNERWKKDRLSIARQAQFKLTYEPLPWTEIAMDVNRYYSTPSTARTVSTMNYHKVDIINDREWKFECKFENYRDYNVRSLSLEYSFFR